MKKIKQGTKIETEHMAFDHVFNVDGSEELCHHTGYNVYLDGMWWNEYIDSNGDVHYGN